MLQMITEYWLTWIFGLIAAGLGFICRKIYKLYKSEKNHQKTEEQKAFYKGLEDLIEKSSQESQRGDLTLQEQINTMQTGILSIQGQNFKRECRELLKPDKEITLKEFEHLQQEHEIYNKLGGNSDGDFLFATVQEKVSNSLSNAKKSGT